MERATGQLDSINVNEKLYVVNVSGAYITLGFDYAHDRTLAIAKDLGASHLEPKPEWYGTKKGFNAYENALAAAFQAYMDTGHRLTCDLTPQLTGLEGKRVEVVDKYGQKRRFYVGKSTGWMPVHLEIKTRRSSGGEPVSGAPFKSVKVVGHK